MESELDQLQAVAELGARESPGRRVVGGTLLKVVNLAVRGVGSVLLVSISLKYLGREEYGIWIVLQSIMLYVTLFSEIGLGQTVMNLQGVAFAQNDHRRINEIMVTAFCLYWVLIVIVGALLAIGLYSLPITNLLFASESNELIRKFPTYCILFGLLTLASVPLTVFPSTLLGVREISWRQFLDLVGSASLLGGTIAVLLGGGRVLSLILISAIVPIILWATCYRLVRHLHSFLQMSWKYWTPDLCSPLFLHSVFFLLLGSAPIVQRSAGSLLAGRFISLSEVPTIYALLLLYRQVGWSFADLVSRILQPYVIMLEAQGRRERVIFFAQLLTKLTFAGSVLFVIVVWLFGEAVFRLWLGAGFSIGPGLLLGIGISFLIDVLFLPCVNFMVALNRHQKLAAVQVGYSILSPALGAMGTVAMPENRLLGMVTGFVAASLLGQGLLMPWLSIRELRMESRRYWKGFIISPLALGASALLLAAIAFLFSSVLQRAFGSGWLWVWTLVTVLVVVLGTWLFLLGRVERAWVLQFSRDLVKGAV